jgi:hypothetical protein
VAGGNELTPAVEAPTGRPDALRVRQRWIRLSTVEWVNECDQIMLEFGYVIGTEVYEKRKTARNRAERLIRFMVELRLHERWELIEHTEKTKAGRWRWSVEYAGRRDNGSRPETPADTAES